MKQGIVLLVDDEEEIRRSTAQSLQLAGFAVRDFPAAEAALDYATPGFNGVVVSDIRMPGMDGMALLRRLQSIDPGLPVILMTGHGDVPMAVEAMQRGAFDFLQKPFRDDDLAERIRRALARDRRLRSQIGEKDQIRARLERLTPRERQVLRLVTDGKPNKVMAAELGVSQRTVEIHRAHVMRKMGASSLAQLVRMTLIAGA